MLSLFIYIIRKGDTMEQQEITLAFRELLDYFLTKYHCSGAALCRGLKKNSSYISHIKLGKITHVKSTTIANIAKIISEVATQRDPNIHQGTVEKEIREKLSFTNPKHYVVENFQNIINTSRSSDEEPEFLAFIKEKINQLGYSSIVEFTNKIINKEETIEIIYDFKNEIKLASINYASNYFLDVLENRGKITYDDMYILLYCMLKTKIKSAMSEKEKQNLQLGVLNVIHQGLFPSLVDFIHEIYAKPEILNVYISNDVLNQSLSKEEQLYRSKLDTVAYALQSTINPLGDKYPDFVNNLCSNISASDAICLYKIFKSGIIKILSEFIASEPDESKQDALLKTMAGNLIYADFPYIKEIYGYDYTQLKLPSERRKFLDTLRDALPVKNTSRQE